MSRFMSCAIAQLSRLPGATVDRREDGQGLAEYALILALIAIVAVTALVFLGGQISASLSQVGQSISDVS